LGWYFADAFDFADAANGLQPLNDLMQLFDVGNIDRDINKAFP
jgi:hypothetical protein